jgi:uncharacterized membrane protein HdeD (DUF308 family)
LERNWWAVLLRGLAAVLFGVVAIFLPGAAIFSLMLLFAIYLVLDGIFAIVASARAIQKHERWGFLVAEGLLNLLLAALIVVVPGGALLGFVWMIAAWAVVTGALMLAGAWRLRAPGRLWFVLGGALSILWGVLLATMPFVGALILTWWLAGYAIAFGVMLIIAAFRLRKQVTA